MVFQRLVFLACLCASSAASAQQAPQIRINGPLAAMQNGGAVANPAPMGAPAGGVLFGAEQQKMLDASQAVMRRDYPQALSLYGEVLAQNGSNTDAYIQRAIVKRETQDEAGMRADATMAVRLSQMQLQQNPQNARAYYQRGTGYRLLKNFSQARSDIQQAIALSNGRHADWRTDLNAIALEEKIAAAGQ